MPRTIDRFTKHLLLALSLTLPFAARALPRAEPVPGGIAVVPLAKTTAPQPKAYYGGKRVMVVADRTSWYAVVGLDLNTPPGSHTLQFEAAGGEPRTARFEVHSKQYETQYITLKKTRFVDPATSDLVRIRHELALSRKAFETWTEDSEVTTAFMLPIHGIVTGTFGKRRFFNNQPRMPHSGLDLAAPKGTPIKAPAPGRVIEVGKYFFNGNTLFLDHGDGLVSMFCHMNKVDVKVGDVVKAGEVIGEVGATGRVTGPHLHWTVSLNDARVDPTLFLSGETVASLQGL